MAIVSLTPCKALANAGRPATGRPRRACAHAAAASHAGSYGTGAYGEACFQRALSDCLMLQGDEQQQCFVDWGVAVPPPRGGVNALIVECELEDGERAASCWQTVALLAETDSAAHSRAINKQMQLAAEAHSRPASAAWW